MSPLEARTLLEPIYERLQALGFPRHKDLKPGVQEFGGGISKKSFDIDTYISHKSAAGEAVSLSIVQAHRETAYIVVHRRRRDGRSMPNAVVDRIPLEQMALASELFLVTAKLISLAPNSWLPVHPSDA